VTVTPPWPLSGFTPTQLTGLEAVHEQPLVAVTWTEAVPPSAGCCVPRLPSAKRQGAGAWASVVRWPFSAMAVDRALA
jgi:hypothetical protein